MLILLVLLGASQVATLLYVRTIGAEISEQYASLINDIFAQDNNLTKVSFRITEFIGQNYTPGSESDRRDKATVTERARRIISFASFLKSTPRISTMNVLIDDPLFIESRITAGFNSYQEIYSELVGLYTTLYEADGDIEYDAALDEFMKKSLDFFYVIADYSGIIHQLEDVYYAYLRTATMRELRFQRIAVFVSAVVLMLFAVLFVFFTRFERTTRRTILRQNDLLEEAISQRTKELREINVQLREEITKHKATLASRKQAEVELAFQASLLKQVHSGVITLDLNNKIIYWNKYAEELYQWKNEEAMGKDIVELLSPEEMKNTVANNFGIIHKEGHWEGEFNVKRKDGSTIPTLISNTLLKDLEGKTIGIIGISTDIRERKQAEKALRESDEQLRQAQKMESIGRLAGGVAHDFNNLLTTIIGYTEIIESSLDASAPMSEYVKEVLNAADRATQLTSQLLAFSRKQTIAPRVIDINETLEHSQKMIKRLIEENIDLLFVPGKDLWQIKIDPGQFDQVLLNLAVNARDAMPRGGSVTFETANVVFDEANYKAIQFAKPGEFVMLTVSDDGCGMDKDVLGNIFEPFFTTKELGSGLGLSMVYGIVKQHNGFIIAESEPGQGTSIKIYLPRASEEMDVISRHEGKIPVVGTETILLAEDEDQVRRLAARILRANGYHVLEEGTAFLQKPFKSTELLHKVREVLQRQSRLGTG